MLRVKDQRRTKDEPRNDLRTPKRKKVLLLRLLPTQEQLKERMELLQKQLRETKRLMNKCTE